jgi:hypothetical protein
MQFDFWRLRKEKLGRWIEDLDFTTSCDEFIGVTSNMNIAVWTID